MLQALEITNVSLVPDPVSLHEVLDIFKNPVVTFTALVDLSSLHITVASALSIDLQ